MKHTIEGIWLPSFGGYDGIGRHARKNLRLILVSRHVGVGLKVMMVTFKALGFSQNMHWIPSMVPHEKLILPIFFFNWPTLL